MKCVVLDAENNPKSNCKSCKTVISSCAGRSCSLLAPTITSNYRELSMLRRSVKAADNELKMVIPAVKWLLTSAPLPDRLRGGGMTFYVQMVCCVV